MANGRQDKRKEPSLSPPLIRREQESVQGKWAGAAGSRSLLEAEEGEVVATPRAPGRTSSQNNLNSSWEPRRMQCRVSWTAELQGLQGPEAGGARGVL